MAFSTRFSLLFLLLLPLLLAIAVSALRVSPFDSVPDSWPTMAAAKKRLLEIQAPFEFEEATVAGIQAAFKDGTLTSYKLVQHYLNQITALNPKLNAVLEVNPDALADASQSDRRRSAGGPKGSFDGIPVLVKDSISTRDKLNTTSGSFALLGSVVPRDAGVIKRLRDAGAIILGKASMSEWDHFRSLEAPQGWSPRGGQGMNPYPAAGHDPCGTSSGSAIAVAANLVAVSLGTDLDAAITCPAMFNSVVGIKPTVGLTSRSGIVPISPRLDTVGPIARTVADAVALLDVIVGIDPLDKIATEAAAKFIPNGGFQKYLNVEGLNGKRIGILRHPFFDDYPPGSLEENTFADHFKLMRQKGAILIDNVEMKNTNIMINYTKSGEATVLLAEFKLSLNSYLKDLVSTPVRSLADVIVFNNQHPTEERMKELGQIIFLASEETNGIGAAEQNAMSRMTQLCKEGIEALMKEKSLDALIFSLYSASHVMALGGYPVVTVPAGYSKSGAPFGISFAGLLGSDVTLIEIAYAFEQATKIRKPPPLG